MKLSEREREQVLREIYPDLLRRTRIACRRGGIIRAHDMDDVLQDVCVALLTKWPQFRGDGELWSWVWTIISNRVHDHRRFLSRFDSLGDDPGDGTAIFATETSRTLAHDPHTEACVSQVIAQLEQEPRARRGAVRTIEVLEFAVIHGADTSALAQFLACTLGAAKERKRYALQKFRELCAYFCGTDECAMSSGARS